MSKHRQILYTNPIPQDWLDQIQEFIGSYVSANFQVTIPTTTSLRVPAGADNAQVAIAINGRWRYITANADAAVPGSPALIVGDNPIFVAASDNSFTGGGGGTNETDLTDYNFRLLVLSAGQTPTGVGAQALYRQVGVATWDGAKFTGVKMSLGPGAAWTGSPDISYTAGKVGIGTTTPASFLHVVSDGSVDSVIAERDSADATGVHLTLRKARGTPAAPANVVNGDAITSLRAAPYSNGFMPLTFAHVEVDGAYTAGQQPPTRIVLYTNLANAGAVEALRIDSSGKATLASTLTVAGVTSSLAGGTSASLADATPVNLFLYDTGAAGGNGGTVAFGAASAGTGRFAAIKGMLTNGGTVGPLGDLVFSTRNLIGDTALTERLRIYANGVVGLPSAGTLAWNNDTSFARYAAGVVQIGSAFQFGTDTATRFSSPMSGYTRLVGNFQAYQVDVDQAGTGALLRFGSSGDATLGRSSAGVLVSAGALLLTGSGGGGNYINLKPGANSSVLYAGLSTDTTNRFTIDADGRQQWGLGGVAALTTALYSPGTGVLTLNKIGGGSTFFQMDGGGGIAEFQVTPTGDFLYNVNGVAAGVLNISRAGAVANSIVVTAGVVKVGGPATGGSVANLELRSTGAAAGIAFYNTSAGLRAFIDMDAVSNVMRIQNQNNGSFGSLVLNPNGGSVGIGVSPTAPLTVNGDVALVGAARYLYASDTNASLNVRANGSGVLYLQRDSTTGDVNFFNGLVTVTNTGALTAFGALSQFSTGATTVQVGGVGPSSAYAGFLFVGDASLYRSNANQVATDGDFWVAKATNGTGAGSRLYFGLSADTYLYRSGAGVLQTNGRLDLSTNLNSYIGNSAQISLTSSGGIPVIYFGSAQDTNLYRYAAGVITSDSVIRGMHLSTVSGGGLAYGTSFPGSPFDGQEYTLVDSTTNPTYQIKCRYNAGSSSAYKWEVVGGGGALEGTTTITIPRAGDWHVEIGAKGAVFGANVQVILDLTAGGIALSAEQGAGSGGTEGVYGSAFDKGRMNALTASQVLTPTVTGAPTRQFIRAYPARLA
jgi:hypothetical protein